VLTSIIDGKIVMENRKVLNLNEGKVIKNAQRMRNDLCEKAGQKTTNLLDTPWPSDKAAWRIR